MSSGGLSTIFQNLHNYEHQEESRGGVGHWRGHDLKREHVLNGKLLSQNEIQNFIHVLEFQICSGLVLTS